MALIPDMSTAKKDALRQGDTHDLGLTDSVFSNLPGVSNSTVNLETVECVRGCSTSIPYFPVCVNIIFPIRILGGMQK